MTTKRRISKTQAPGVNYQYRLSDLQRMVEQFGGRAHLQIVPAESVTSAPSDFAACLCEACSKWRSSRVVPAEGTPTRS